MVHALNGIWRVLTSNGTLVDLRPIPCQCPIEFVTASQAVHVGEVDATGMADDDAASDQAICKVVNQGLFVPLHNIQFDFDFYWDSVQEMASFKEDMSAGCGERVRPRFRRRTALTVYQKD